MPNALATVLLALSALSTTACASPAMRAPDDAQWLRIDVIDRDTGVSLPLHRHRGAGWVAGEDGQPYTLRLQNLSGERLLVVLSVDGVNVVTGETAAPSQSGYVLGPWSHADIEGWRKSMQDVAAFRFSAAGDSYAARTGRPFDLGVIGAAVFREAVVPEPWPLPAPPVASAERESRQRAESPRANAAESSSGLAQDAAPAAAAPLGTAHGERRWSPTTRTAFQRASARPDELVGLRYDRFEALVSRGVIRREPTWPMREPRAFPAAFVADP
jgi:hypothetical protein